MHYSKNIYYLCTVFLQKKYTVTFCILLGKTSTIFLNLIDLKISYSRFAWAYYSKSISSRWLFLKEW